MDRLDLTQDKLVFDVFHQKWVAKNRYTPKELCPSCKGVGHTLTETHGGKYKRSWRKICDKCFGDGHVFVAQEKE